MNNLPSIINIYSNSKQQLSTMFFMVGVLLLLLVISTKSGWSQTQTFTTSGTFTVPLGVTSVTVECWGGGGAGGGNSSNNSRGGGGGAGGAYAAKVINVTPGNNYSVTVAALKAGINGAGGAGNPSWFGTTATVYAEGGEGGAAADGGTVNGGVGSVTSSIGTIVYAGGNGANGTSSLGGGGGGGAGSNGIGGNASGIIAGNGTSIGGGNGGAGRNSENNGNSGSTAGGGGGGAYIPDNTNHSGGIGAAGQVIISWVVPPALTVIPTTLDLGYIVSGGTSLEYSYALSGTNLTGAPGNILVTAPSNFEVSLTSAYGFSTSVNVPYTGTSLASTTIYVRFKPTTPNINYNGNITNSVGGAVTQNVAVTGTSLLAYCNSSGNTTYQTSITLVNFNTINNITAKPSGYSDYTSQITSVKIGNSYNLTTNVNTDGNYVIYARVWIDWNQNGNFNDAGETFNLGTTQNTTNGICSLCPYSITVPSGALSGNTRMRISAKYNAYPTSCETNIDGEVEDYTLNVFTDAIATAAISGSPFCAGANISVPFNITGSFSSGNVFTAQLSNSSGNFATAINIGTLTATTAATISATIPLGTITGSSYRIRVVASTPAVVGTENGSNLAIITNLPVSLSIAASANPVCSGTSVVFTATPTNGGSTPVYQWKLNGSNVGTNSNTYSNASLANGNTVSCILTSNATPCATGSPATSNTLTMTVNPIPGSPSAAGATICIGSTASLFASGAIAGDKYKWYDAASGGNLLKTSTNNTDNIFTTPVLISTTNYWVAKLTAAGCESSRNQVTATYPSASADDQNASASNSWIGHVYDGTNLNTYYGSFAETETFDQNFGGDNTCFGFTSNSIPRSIYTETFSVRYRMNSTKKGLYIVDLGSDDGGRLTIDGSLLYNNWSDLSFTSIPRVLMSMNGSSSLIYDFYENGGGNRVVFQNLTLVIANSLSANTTQNICLGNTGAVISGDVYGTLPTGVTLSGTGYQWTYSTTPMGVRSNLSGATGATYTPNTSATPFNAAGTYYLFRNTLLSSSNNVSPNPYVVTNESNAATIIVNPIPVASFGYMSTPYCSNASNPSPTFTNGGIAGIFSSTAGLNFVSTATGQINLATSTAGTYTVTNTIAASGGCGVVTSTSPVTITTLPAATISYAGTPFCKSIATAQSVIRTGTSGGTYTALPAGITINASTGAVTPSTSTAGVYTVTYTIAAANGCGVVTTTTGVTITAVPTATIGYTGTPFCNSLITAQSITLNGTGAYTGGVYTSVPAGLSINASSGAITPSTSTAGSYTVTYAIPASGGCATVPVTTPVTITTQPKATFSYTATPYCSNASNPLPTFTNGGVAGIFSSTAGLNFVSTTAGQINLATSTAGSYTVTNTIAAAGGCGVVTSTSPVTITTLPAATISYAGNPFCKSIAIAQSVTRTGTAGGTYTALPAGLSINASTGAITPGTSTAGIYTVTYSLAASGGCGIVTTTTSVTITTLPIATFSYAGTSLPTFSGGGVAGIFSSTSGLIFVNTTTGEVNLATSTPGTYTVTNTIAAAGGCSVVTASNSITVTTLQTLGFVWGGSISTNWNISANWMTGVVPGVNSDAIIPDASTTLFDPVLPLVPQASVKTISMHSNAILNGGTATTLTIAGSNSAWSNLGTFNSGTSKVIITNANATMTGQTNFYDFTIVNGAGLTPGSGNVMRIAGSLTLQGTGILRAAVNANTIEYNGTNQTVVNPNGTIPGYANLILSGSGTKTLPGNTLNVNGDLFVSGTAQTTAMATTTVGGNLTIANGCKLMVSPIASLNVQGTFTNNAGTTGFVLKSDATGTASLIHHTNNVAATVQRYISGAAESWHFLSSPVVAQSISGNWTPSGTYGNGTGYDLYSWYEPSSCWIYKLNTTSDINWNTIHSGNDFIVGRGYLYSAQASTPTNTFVGNLNNAAIDYYLTINSPDINLNGFNFVGNPYPSSIDWQAASGWSRSNLLNSGGGYDMWIYNKAAGNYGVCNSFSGSGTNGVTRYIAPMQGFFVRAASAANLGMNNAIRVHEGAGAWFKNTDAIDRGLFSVVVQSEADQSFDEVRLMFGYAEPQQGAAKMFSPIATAPSLYLPSADKFFSVRYLTDTIDNPMVPLKFKAGTDGKYTINCNFDVEKYGTVMLEDRQMHSIQNMKAKKSYRFQSLTADDASRFILHFGPAQNASYDELPARIYTDGNQLIIDLSLVGKETEMNVYDVTGRLLLHQSLQGAMLNKLNLNVKSQILTVQLINQQGNISRKMFFNNKNE